MRNINKIQKTSFNLQSWDVFFRNTDQGAPPGAAYQAPPGIRTAVSTVSAPITAAPQFDTENMLSTKVIDDHLAVQAIIRSYQVQGMFVVFLSSFLYIMGCL